LLLGLVLGTCCWCSHSVKYMMASREQMAMAMSMDHGGYCNFDFRGSESHHARQGCRPKAKPVVQVSSGFGGGAHAKAAVDTHEREIARNYFCPKAWVPGRAGGFMHHDSKQGCCLLDAASSVAESMYLMHQCGFSYGLGMAAKQWATREKAWLARVCTLVDPMPTLNDITRRCCAEKKSATDQGLRAAGITVSDAAEGGDGKCTLEVWKIFTPKMGGFSNSLDAMSSLYEQCVGAKQYASRFQEDPYAAQCEKKQLDKLEDEHQWGKKTTKDCKRPAWMGKADRKSITPEQRQKEIKLMREAESVCGKAEALLGKLMAAIHTAAKHMYNGHDGDMTSQSKLLLAKEDGTLVGLKQYMAERGGMEYDTLDMERYRKDKRLQKEAKRANEPWEEFLDAGIGKAETDIHTALRLRKVCATQKFKVKGCEQYWGPITNWSPKYWTVYCNWYPDVKACSGEQTNKPTPAPADIDATEPREQFAPEDCDVNELAGPGCEAKWPKNRRAWTSKMWAKYCEWYPKFLGSESCRYFVKHRVTMAPTMKGWEPHSPFGANLVRNEKGGWVKRVPPSVALEKAQKARCAQDPSVSKACLPLFPQDRDAWDENMRTAYCTWFAMSPECKDGELQNSDRTLEKQEYGKAEASRGWQGGAGLAPTADAAAATGQSWKQKKPAVVHPSSADDDNDRGGDDDANTAHLADMLAPEGSEQGDGNA
jgi:hypothetical protein